MAGPRCKLRSSIRNVTVPAAGTVEVELPADVAEFTLQAVDAAGAAVAWSFSYRGSPDDFHFAAGLSWTEERLRLEDPIVLVIAAAADSIVEVVTWEG